MYLKLIQGTGMAISFGKGLMIKNRYCTEIQDLPYYQIKYPKPLHGHPQVTSIVHKRRLRSSKSNTEAILAEINQLNQELECSKSLLLDSNLEVLWEIELEKQTTTYLKHHNLSPGAIAQAKNFSEQDRIDMEAWGTGMFDDMPGGINDKRWSDKKYFIFFRKSLKKKKLFQYLVLEKVKKQKIISVYCYW